VATTQLVARTAHFGADPWTDGAHPAYSDRMHMLARGARCAMLAVLSLSSACGHPHSPAAQASQPPAPSTAGFGREVQEGITQLREATAPYRDFDAAVAAGYARDVTQCLAHPPHGAMGFHHVNRGYVDNRIEVERPEILTYEREAGGRYALTGAEYIIPYRLWPADSTPPTVFGQSLKRSSELRLWYLHAWIWKENPTGLFADWNPAIRCPAR